MTLNQIVKLATDAGFENANEPGFWISDGFYLTAIEMFAALVAAAEREACAKVAEITYDKQIVWYPKGHYIDPNSLGDINKAVAEGCAAAIRARGE